MDPKPEAADRTTPPVTASRSEEDPLERLTQLLDGHFPDFGTEPPGSEGLPEWLARWAGVTTEYDAGPPVLERAREWCASGRRLRALALLKVLLAGGAPPDRIAEILEALLGEDARLALDPVEADPDLHEFLGSDRPEFARAALQGDHLELRLLPRVREALGGNCFVVNQATNPHAPDSLDHWALVWRIQHLTEDRARARRKTTRHRLSYEAGITFVGGSQQARSPSKADAWIVDLSLLGMGLTLDDPYSQYSLVAKKGARVRLSLARLERSDTCTCLAEIAWTKVNLDTGPRSIQLGLRYITPTPEFEETVRRLLAENRGDRQLLWKLWDLELRG